MIRIASVAFPCRRGQRFARLEVCITAFASPSRLTTDGSYFRQASRIVAMLSLVKQEMPRKQTVATFYIGNSFSPLWLGEGVRGRLRHIT